MAVVAWPQIVLVHHHCNHEHITVVNVVTQEHQHFKHGWTHAAAEMREDAPGLRKETLDIDNKNEVLIYFEPSDALVFWRLSIHCANGKSLPAGLIGMSTGCLTRNAQE
jgi:hypothetical protein